MAYKAFEQEVVCDAVGFFALEALQDFLHDDVQYRYPLCRQEMIKDVGQAGLFAIEVVNPDRGINDQHRVLRAWLPNRLPRAVCRAVGGFLPAVFVRLAGATLLR